MYTFHFYFSGIVQGVGFRPFIYNLASKLHLNGWVSNTIDGVHIEFNADNETADQFLNEILTNPPTNALITEYHSKKISFTPFTSFSILSDYGSEKGNLMVTPDLALCDDCINDLLNPENKRFKYPFTTCLKCGPRYTILYHLPYDRPNTSLNYLKMCPHCKDEFFNPLDRRFYSQTNSCPLCAVKMHMYIPNKKELPINQEEIIPFLASKIFHGAIVAVKGIGGYLLLCDATSSNTIKTLRNRKNRPSKPFAVLYNSIEEAEKDAHIKEVEKKWLKSAAAPIVLCSIKNTLSSVINIEGVAENLDKIGIMLPYSPLLFLISNEVNKPLVATSANISGAPVIFNDEDALNNLFPLADYILTFDRDITTTQDDSVVQFTKDNQLILLRRGRGFAPNFFPNPLKNLHTSLLAFGAELKSSFAFNTNKNLFVSQFLGNHASFDAQLAFNHTLRHLLSLLKINPTIILADSHPNYDISKTAITYRNLLKSREFIRIQHHKAHFGAVLAENHALDIQKPILGFIWDGAGYGDDGNIWGSEVFLYENHQIERLYHISYFPQLLNDKMSREPRLSALVLLGKDTENWPLIRHHFSEREWQYFQKICASNKMVLTSSMARFLEGIACLLGVGPINDYEGQVLLHFENLARKYPYELNEWYSFIIQDDSLDYPSFLASFLEDVKNKRDKSMIAKKVLFSLVKAIEQICVLRKVNHIAFSGGVFQNALLVELIRHQFKNKNITLFFHKNLSPNDENIAFGQLAIYSISQLKNTTNVSSHTWESHANYSSIG
jgi:hydrogenase maturation protein HypF